MKAAVELILSEAELELLTGYRNPAHQLRELHRQGFMRARSSRLGGVILERAHYEAVCRGAAQPPARPMLKSQRQRLASSAA